MIASHSWDNRFDDVLLTGIGIYQSQGNLTKAWIFFEDSLIQVDFEQRGLRFGRELGCDVPLSPSVNIWKHIQEASKTNRTIKSRSKHKLLDRFQDLNKIPRDV